MEFENRLTSLEKKVENNKKEIERLESETVKKDYLNKIIETLEDMIKQDIRERRIKDSMMKDDVTEIKLILKGSKFQEMETTTKFIATSVGKLTYSFVIFLICIAMLLFVSLVSSYAFPIVMETLTKNVKEFTAFMFAVSSFFAFLGFKTLKGGV